MNTWEHVGKGKESPLTIFDAIDVRKDNVIDCLELQLALETTGLLGLDLKQILHWVCKQSRVGKPFLTRSEFFLRFQQGSSLDACVISSALVSLSEPARLKNLQETYADRLARIDVCTPFPFRDSSFSYKQILEPSENKKLPPLKNTTTRHGAGSSTSSSKATLNNRKFLPQRSVTASSKIVYCNELECVGEPAFPWRGHASAFEPVQNSEHRFSDSSSNPGPAYESTVSRRKMKHTVNEVDSVPLASRINVKPEYLKKMAVGKNALENLRSLQRMRSSLRRMEFRAPDNTELAIREFHRTSCLPTVSTGAARQDRQSIL
mmetsp:Transcript_23446/g.56124  ORF Transcript_23446/g.56124 Transcript_23446/m.56124 type:complete len:320 (+) Transcript_23446:149-1108(+)